MSDLTAEDFEAIIAAMLDRIERIERENREIKRAARDSETAVRSEIAGLTTGLVACEVPLIREYYAKPRDQIRPGL